MRLDEAGNRTGDGDYQAMVDGNGHEEALGGHELQSNARGISGSLEENAGEHERHPTEDEACQYAADDGHKERPSTLYGVTGYIIIMEFCERLAYYGFAGELVPDLLVSCYAGILRYNTTATSQTATTTTSAFFS